MLKQLRSYFNRSHLLLLIIVLLMVGITVMSMTGSHAAEDLHHTIKQTISTNIFDLESPGRDGNGQRTIG